MKLVYADSQIAQRGHRLGGPALGDLAGVFTISYVAAMMGAVFDGTEVIAGDFKQLLVTHLPVKDAGGVIGNFAGFFLG